MLDFTADFKKDEDAAFKLYPRQRICKFKTDDASDFGSFTDSIVKRIESPQQTEEMSNFFVKIEGERKKKKRVEGLLGVVTKHFCELKVKFIKLDSSEKNEDTMEVDEEEHVIAKFIVHFEDKIEASERDGFVYTVTIEKEDGSNDHFDWLYNIIELSDGSTEPVTFNKVDSVKGRNIEDEEDRLKEGALSFARRQFGLPLLRRNFKKNGGFEYLKDEKSGSKEGSETSPLKRNNNKSGEKGEIDYVHYNMTDDGVRMVDRIVQFDAFKFQTGGLLEDFRYNF